MSRKTRIELILTAVYVGIMAALLLVFAGCSTVSSTPPADWPELKVNKFVLPHTEMLSRCTLRGVLLSHVACALIYFDSMQCDVIISEEFAALALIEAHEREHCLGKDHAGEDTLARAWESWKSKVKDND